MRDRGGIHPQKFTKTNLNFNCCIVVSGDCYKEKKRSPPDG